MRCGRAGLLSIMAAATIAGVEVEHTYLIVLLYCVLKSIVVTCHNMYSTVQCRNVCSIMSSQLYSSNAEYPCTA